MKIRFIVLSMVLMFSLMVGSVAVAKEYVSKQIPSDLALVENFLVSEKNKKKHEWDIAILGKFKISEGNYQIYYKCVFKGKRFTVNSKNLRRLDTGIWILGKTWIIQ